LIQLDLHGLIDSINRHLQLLLQQFNAELFSQAVIDDIGFAPDPDLTGDVTVLVNKWPMPMVGKPAWSS